MEMGAEEEIDEDFSIDELLAELKKKSKKVEVKKVVKKEDETEKAKKELDEAIKVVRALRGELQEMKLFNAKLLYTNKIFKARNLNESQKVKVLSTFDKAGTIKEVELVYETLSSSFVTAKKQVVKESLGFASKPTGVSQKQVIVEEDAMVKRFKKLAGLI
jgi:RAB protein geranylgeranyltransferase component A